jgi:hypothetical protein
MEAPRFALAKVMCVGEAECGGRASSETVPRFLNNKPASLFFYLFFFPGLSCLLLCQAQRRIGSKKKKGGVPWSPSEPNVGRGRREKRGARHGKWIMDPLCQKRKLWFVDSLDATLTYLGLSEVPDSDRKRIACIEG